MTIGSKFDSIAMDDLRDAYYELGSIKATADHFGCGTTVIKRLLNKRGIPSLPKWRKKYSADEDFFAQDNEKSFYWAGFLAADGCVYGSNTPEIVDTLHLKLSSHDLLHLERFKSDLVATNPIFIKKHGKSKKTGLPLEYCEMRIFSRKIVNDLRRFNIVPAKTLIYAFPEWLMTHPMVHHYMRGYIDGDGCFTISSSKRKTPQVVFSLVSASKSFLLDFRAILNQRCEVVDGPAIALHHQADDDHNEMWGVSYHGNDIATRIRNFLYAGANTFLNRKREVACMVDRYRLAIQEEREQREADRSRETEKRSLQREEERKEWDRYLAETAQALIDDGYSRSEAAAIMKVDRHTISKRLPDLKSTWRPPLTKEELQAAYDKTGTVYGVVEELNANFRTVRKYLDLYQIESKIKQSPTKEMLVHAFEKLGSIKSVARELGYNWRTTKKYLLEYAIIKEDNNGNDHH